MRQSQGTARYQQLAQSLRRHITVTDRILLDYRAYEQDRIERARIERLMRRETSRVLENTRREAIGQSETALIAEFGSNKVHSEQTGSRVGDPGDSGCRGL